MNRDLNFWRCNVCDYLGPAFARNGMVACNDCGHNQLEGDWVDYTCDCGFTAKVYQPAGGYEVPEHCCDINGENCKLMVSTDIRNAFER